MSELKEYKVWDVPVRWFHWLNVLFMILLIFSGLLILNLETFGLAEVKLEQKALHTIIGYFFAVNLTLRMIWFFIGNKYASWRAALFIPTPSALRSVKIYIQEFFKGESKQYLGHNPMGKLAVTLLYLFMLGSLFTGLIRAGTDLYYPPFGYVFASYVAIEGEDPAKLNPMDMTQHDLKKLKKLKRYKYPIGTLHLYTSYVLIFLIVLHIFAVVVTENKEGGGLVSAMFTGKKVLSKKPADKRES